jgi:predicted nucleotidyltransferase
VDSRDTISNVQRLEQKHSASWPSIRKARERTAEQRISLAGCFVQQGSPDTSLVVFGSLAREEWTSRSDLDWIFLVDGQSLPEHKNQEFDIAKRLADNGFGVPGASGIFGCMVSSHDLVHNIGGEDDPNSNTTRRVLLLLESYAIGSREAYDRVRRQIVRRYLEDDRGLTHGSGTERIPRFLLNDITRYWRTVTVDFVYKQRSQQDKKWALRNAKLRMSRKLIFAAGLANVFLCHLDPEAEQARDQLMSCKDVDLLTAYLSAQLAKPPLETLAKLCWLVGAPEQTTRAIFDNYDRFLGILDDPRKREDLEAAHGHEQLRASSVWGEVRNLSHPFHDALVSLFLKDVDELRRLSMTYGIF